MTRTRLLFALGCFFASYFAFAQNNAPLRLADTVRLPDVHGRIDHFDADVQGKRLFMSALGNNTLEVFDLTTNSRTHTIRGLQEPQGVTFVPAASRIFVANGGDGEVRIFDGKTYDLVKTVPLGSDAGDTRLDEAKGQVYVGFGDEGNAGLAILDGATGNQAGVIKLPGHPEGFQLEESGPRIYVNIPSANNIVAVVDRNERKIVARWKIGRARENFPMALDEEDHRLFIVCRAPPELLALDTQSGRVVAEVPAVGHADDVWYDSTHKRVFVSGGDGYITVVSEQDASRYRRIAEFRTAPGGRTSFLAAKVGRLYLGVWGRSGPEQLRVYDVEP